MDEITQDQKEQENSFHLAWDIENESEEIADDFESDEIEASNDGDQEALAEDDSQVSLADASEEYSESLWKVDVDLSEDEICGAVETLIFLSDKPVPLEKVRSSISDQIPLRVYHEAIERLKKGFDTPDHGIRLVEVAEGYQFRTKPRYAKYVREQLKLTKLSLTPLAMEVLAIIVYKQPITKVDIDDLRGVDSSHLIRLLIDKKLVRVASKPSPGKSAVYETTTEFLEIFELNKLDDLPPLEELTDIVDQNSVGDVEDIREVVRSEKAQNLFEADMSEIAELESSIKEIRTDTDFLKTLKTEQKAADKAEGDVAPKSAFDILEDYVHQEEIEAINQAALEVPEMGELEQGLLGDEESLDQDVSADSEDINTEDANTDDFNTAGLNMDDGEINSFGPSDDAEFFEIEEEEPEEEFVEIIELEGSESDTETETETGESAEESLSAADDFEPENLEAEKLELRQAFENIEESISDFEEADSDEASLNDSKIDENVDEGIDAAFDRLIDAAAQAEQVLTSQDSQEFKDPGESEETDLN